MCVRYRHARAGARAHTHTHTHKRSEVTRGVSSMMYFIAKIKYIARQEAQGQLVPGFKKQNAVQSKRHSNKSNVRGSSRRERQIGGSSRRERQNGVRKRSQQERQNGVRKRLQRKNSRRG
jgi:hypothetical protein